MDDRRSCRREAVAITGSGLQTGPFHLRRAAIRMLDRIHHQRQPREPPMTPTGHHHGTDHDHGHDHDQGHDHDHGDYHDHGHGHGHGHGGAGGQDHAHRTGVLGFLTELVAPHIHDAAVSLDSELETSRRGMRALLISFAALLVTAAVQLVVVVLSDSVALLGDTIHNFADAMTAVPIAVAFTLGRRAATRRYTYGYGRAEDLAGIAVV